MAILTVTTITRAGQDISDGGANMASAAGGGDSFPNTGVEFVKFSNGDIASKTVTLVVTATVDGQAVSNKTITVGAGVEKLFGPFPPATYNNGSNRVSLTYSDVTSCKIGVFTLTTS